MIRPLVLVGIITAAFGLGSQRVLGEISGWSALNIGIGAASLTAALVLFVRQLGQSQQPALRRPMWRAIGSATLICLAAMALHQAAVRSDVRFDWTFEGTFELSPATLTALQRLSEPLEATLYFDVGDPRIRNTRLLLEEIARAGDVEVAQRRLDDHPEDEDRFGIGSSNSVVLRIGQRWELVQRPTEGGLYEALSRLVTQRNRVLYVGVGAGEGDLERGDDLGFSGLRAALETEGYEPRPLPLAVVDEIPADAAAVLMLAPRRGLHEAALQALERYIDGGGSLLAFLEPGVESGIEGLLAHYGIHPLDGWVIDPASGPVEGDPAGLNPIAHAYIEHPATRGLDANRMTFFRRSRAFRLRKAQPEDRLTALVYASRDSWVSPTDPRVETLPQPYAPDGVRTDYHALVAAVEIDRGPRPGRIVAFGDASLAANRYLRSLYNLDLVMNAVHWVVDRDSAITIRPKSGGRQLIQFPVPLETSLQALYGVGLLIPELLLLGGGLVWLRQRSA
jgi:hypothetical protein